MSNKPTNKHEFEEYLKGGRIRFLVTVKSQKESDMIFALLGAFNLKVTPYSEETHYVGGSDTGVAYTSNLGYAWLTSQGDHCFNEVFTYKEFMNMFEEPVEQEYIVTQEHLKSVIKFIQDKNEFGVPVKNQMQADVVMAVLKGLGLQQSTTNTSGKFVDSTKSIHNFAGIGYWCSGFNAEGETWKLISYEDILSIANDVEEAPVQIRENDVYKIKFKHLRVDEYNRDGYYIGNHNLGGLTLAYVKRNWTGSQGSCPEVEASLAICSDQDNFCRKQGRDIAQKRFLSGAALTMTEQEFQELSRMSVDEFMQSDNGKHLIQITKANKRKGE